MRKIRLIAEAVCLITSMTITPVVTSVEKNHSCAKPMAQLCQWGGTNLRRMTVW